MGCRLSNFSKFPEIVGTEYKPYGLIEHQLDEAWPKRNDTAFVEIACNLKHMHRPAYLSNKALFPCLHSLI